MKTLFATVRQPSVTPTQAGGNNGLLYTAQSRYSGKAGEAISITLLDNGANKPLVVSVNGLAISVQLATDASDTITTIANDIVDAIDRHQDARALVFVQCTEGSGEGTGPARAVSQTFLAGGTGVGVSGANVVVFTRDMAGVNPFTVILENTDG